MTTTRRQHVLYPFRLAAVGKRNDEATTFAKHVYWRAIHLARFAAYMSQNAEPGQPSREQPCDPISENDVELRQPAFAEAHHQDCRGRDGEKNPHGLSMALENG